MNEEITIMLTTPEAMMFREYQQFHKAFAILVKSGVFDVQFGNASINIANGEIQNIKIEHVAYHK